MAKNVLSLEIPDVTNTCILSIRDTGLYDPLIPVSCFTLQVTSPGFWEPSTITTLIPNFTTNLTACALGLQTTNCDNYNNDLQDGVYIIKLSLSPNDLVFVEYNHLRITKALNQYQALLCCIQSKFDCTPAPEIKDKINQARDIRTYLDAAKAEVEYCHHPSNGIATYLYATSLLTKLSCLCGCGDIPC